MSESIQRDLLERDKCFVKNQIDRQNLDLVLLNGSAVIKGFERAFSYTLKERTRIEEGKLSCKFYSATLEDGVKVIGWSTNLQSSIGVTNTFRATIGQTAARLANIY